MEQRFYRWRARPLASLALRTFVAILPIVASLLCVIVASRIVRAPSESLFGYLAWWVGLCALSTLVLVGIDKVARRLLPLGALLKLSLVFPDATPSRFKIALRSGTVKQLHRVVAEAKAGHVGETPAEAAERVLELVAALNAHDRLTRGHSERVRAYTQMIAEELGLAAADIDLLHWAGLLHDIGKLEVPYEILNKSTRPTQDEWEILKGHPEAGARLVAPLNGWLGEWVHAVDEHHERWDGKGYPHGLAGDDISYAARIVSVADVFDVITSARSYKDPIDATTAREEIARCSGTQFDPEVVRAFLTISLGRLRFAMGPLSLLAQSPLGGVSIPPVIGAAVSGLAVGAVSVVGGIFAGPSPTPASAARAASPPAAVAAPAPKAPDLRTQIEEDTPTVVRIKGLATESLKSVAITSASAGLATAQPGGSAMVMPPPNFNGVLNFGYRACWLSGCANAKLIVTVKPINDPPLTRPDEVTITQGEVATIDPLATASDPEGDAIVLTDVSVPIAGQASIVSDTILYEPAPDYSGTTSLAYTVGDVNGATAPGSVIVNVLPAGSAPIPVPVGNPPISVPVTNPPITPPPTSPPVVVPVNQPPVASDDTAITTENTPATIAVLGNDSDPDADPLTISAVGAPSFGTASLIGNAVQYSPNFASNGSDAFTYTVTDPSGATSTAVITVTITPVNDAPSFNGGTNLTSLEDAGPQTIPSWATSISPGPANESTQTITFTTTNDNNPLFTTQPAIAPDGTLTYTPATNAYGTATITTNITDTGGTLNGGTNTSPTQTATITITPVPPIPQADAYAVNQDTPLSVAAPGLLANDFDPIANPLTVVTVPVAAPTNGTLTLGTDGSFLYTPNLGFLGSDSFTYQVDDGAGLTATATVSITVNSGITTSGFYLGTTGSNADNYDLISSPPPAAAPVPDFDADGEPGLTLKSSEGNENINDPAKYHLWTSVAPSPLALDGPVTLHLWSSIRNFETGKDATVFAYLFDCAGGGTACVKLLQTQLTLPNWNNGPTWTEHSISLGSLTHTVGAGRELRVHVLAGKEDIWVAMTATEASRLDVTLANVATVANPDTASMLEDAPPTNVAVLANDIDTNIRLNSVSILSAPTLGTAVPLGNGTVNYTPAPDANGADTFTYQVCDSAGLCSSATVAVTIVPVNDAPSFNISASTTLITLGTPVTMPGWATAISEGALNEAGQSLAFTVTNSNPVLFTVAPAIAPDGTLTFTPTGTPGTVTVRVTLTDSGGVANGGSDTSITKTFTIVLL